MAVGVNKRKRKHENISNAEDDNCEGDHVPKKKSKHSFKTHKDDDNFKEEADETSSNTKNVDLAKEEEAKFSKKLKMSTFRIKLRGDNFVTGKRALCDGKL